MSETSNANVNATVQEAGVLVGSAAKPAEQRQHRPYRKGMLRRVMLLLRNLAITIRRWYLCRVLHMDLHPTCKFSLKAQFDFTNPRGVHVDAGSYIAFNAVILSHDMSRLIHADTRIGKNCFIGAHAIILPGVVIGDECIIGSGAVVTRDVPSHSICVGNPAKVIKSGIRTREWGILLDVYEAALAESVKEKQQNVHS